MKALHGSTMKRRVLGLLVLSLAVCVATTNATDICFTHTHSGSDGEQFYPRDSADLLLEVKAPSDGSITAYVTVQGGGMLASISANNGQYSSTVIPGEELGATCIFTSNCTTYYSGTGYSHLESAESTTSPCIPDDNND